MYFYIFVTLIDSCLKIDRRNLAKLFVSKFKKKKKLMEHVIIQPPHPTTHHHPKHSQDLLLILNSKHNYFHFKIRYSYDSQEFYSVWQKNEWISPLPWTTQFTGQHVNAPYCTLMLSGWRCESLWSHIKAPSQKAQRLGP